LHVSFTTEHTEPAEKSDTMFMFISNRLNLISVSSVISVVNNLQCLKNMT